LALRLLVTGGAGFIGSHLVDALLARGQHVRVLDNFSTGRRENLPTRPGLDVLEGDIRDLQICRRAAEGCAAVLHEAALGSVPRSVADPSTTHAVNATGTLNVFIAAHEAGIRRVVYASSSSVYGTERTLPKREDLVGQPLSPYASSKRANELDAAAFARCYDMTLIGLRYFNVYGPRQEADSPYAAVIPSFFKAALKGEPALIHGDGDQSRSFTFVADVVDANLAALEVRIDGDPSPVVNIGTSERRTVNELWHAVCGTVGVSLEARHGPPREGDVRDSLADLTRAREVLGYQPAHRLEEGLAKTLPDYAARIR
jgi:UDP-N-acetylglucosamine/UDP-N-acetyl-alpha-D-glucosaminouronate 4-epimerase